MKTFDLHHYFDWCSLIEKGWSLSVSRNPKTIAVDEKLARWHEANPDKAVANRAHIRMERIRREQRQAVG